MLRQRQEPAPARLPCFFEQQFSFVLWRHQSCFLVNPCAPPRSRTRVVGAGPFARTSVRRVFRRAFTAALPSCGLVSSIGGGRPAPNRLNMSLAIIVTFWPVRNCRERTLWPVDLVGVDIVGVDRNRFAVMLGMITSQVIVISNLSPGCRGFGTVCWPAHRAS